MSKLTLDEAIKHCLEVAENNETQAEKIGRQFIGSAMDKRATDCRECAADHRQLAEWLTELKELRNSVGAIKLVEIKDALNLISEYKAELFEAKRLLKAAVEDINFYVDCFESHCDECCCDHDNHCHWKHEAEALALIGEEGEQNG